MCIRFFFLLFKLFSISVRYSYHQLDASTTLQCVRKSPSFCVVDNEITTNSIYYTTIPSNGNAHGIQTTIFYLVLKTYTIQLCYTPARSASLTLYFSLFLSFASSSHLIGCRLPEKFFDKNIRHSRSKHNQTFIFVSRCFNVWLRPFVSLSPMPLCTPFPRSFVSIGRLWSKSGVVCVCVCCFIAIENPSKNKCTNFVEFCFVFLMAVNR